MAADLLAQQIAGVEEGVLKRSRLIRTAVDSSTKLGGWRTRSHLSSVFAALGCFLVGSGFPVYRRGQAGLKQCSFI